MIKAGEKTLFLPTGTPYHAGMNTNTWEAPVDKLKVDFCKVQP